MDKIRKLSEQEVKEFVVQIKPESFNKDENKDENKDLFIELTSHFEELGICLPYSVLVGINLKDSLYDLELGKSYKIDILEEINIYKIIGNGFYTEYKFIKTIQKSLLKIS